MSYLVIFYMGRGIYFWGSAIRENDASRNLMEKYGGVIIAEDEYPGVVLYECATKPKEDLEKRRRK